MGDLASGPHLMHASLGISISSAVFAQITAECCYTLEWAAPRRSGPHLYSTQFLGPIRAHNQTASRTNGSAFCRAH